MPDINTFISQVSIWAIPVLLAITLHEAAHGFMARRFGDDTAWMLGRVTLNPIKHIDLFGTILLPLVMILLTPFALGYAKPVPVNFMQLKPRKGGAVAVALAGPGANLVLLVSSLALIHLAVMLPVYWAEPLVLMAWASVQINIIIMVFNLLPILPLDGGRVLEAILPRSLANPYAATERYGMIVILLLLVTGLLFTIIGPVLNWFVQVSAGLLPQEVLGL